MAADGSFSKSKGFSAKLNHVFEAGMDAVFGRDGSQNVKAQRTALQQARTARVRGQTNIIGRSSGNPALVMGKSGYPSIISPTGGHMGTPLKLKSRKQVKVDLLDPIEADFQNRKLATVANLNRSATAGTTHGPNLGFDWRGDTPMNPYTPVPRHFTTQPVRDVGAGSGYNDYYSERPISTLPMPGNSGQTLQPLSGSTTSGTGYSSHGVSAPSAVGFHARVSDAEFLKSDYPDGVRLRKREYVTDVFGTTSFFVRTKIPLNPGLETSFPFLSGIASRFQFYEFRSLKIIYLPSCSTSAAGSINLSTDYKPSDSAPATKADVLQYAETARATPWTACEHYCAEENLWRHGDLIVRSSSIDNNDDIELYDIANLYISTGDQAGTTLIGEVWIEYDVELHTTIPPGKYGQSSNQFGSCSGAANFLAATGSLPVSNAYPAISIGGVNSFTFLQDFRGIMEIRFSGLTVATGAGGVFTISTIPDFTHTFTTASEWITSGATLYHRSAACDVRAGQVVTLTFNYTTAPNAYKINFYGLESISNTAVQAVEPDPLSEVEDEDDYKVMLQLARQATKARNSLHV